MELNSCGPALNRISVVTVTYGRRWIFLQQVLEALRKEANFIERIFVVDNGSEDGIANKVANYEIDCEIAVVELITNTGSANGFAAGMIEAAKCNSELMLLLDDDNVMAPGGIRSLISAFQLFADPYRTIVTCLRKDRKEYEITSMVTHSGGRSNFLWFSLAQSLRSAFGARRRLDEPDLISIPYAPYGGTLLASDWVRKVGVPNSEFFLYFDDHEYFSRLRERGAEIYLYRRAVISDVDTSWNRKKARGHFLFSGDTSTLKLYYSVRNSAYLGRQQRRGVMYWINAITLIGGSLLKTIVVERDARTIIQRSALLRRAIADGRAGRLGAVLDDGGPGVERKG